MSAGTDRIAGSAAPDAERPVPADWQDVYRSMTRSRQFDKLALALQRQGGIDGYSEGRGQEGAIVGGIIDLQPGDMVFPSPRDPGAALHRGVTPVQLFRWYRGMDYCPWDWRALGYYAHPIPVGTQCGHATGWAWAARQRGESSVTVVYFGDGAASQGEVHEAMNYAGVFQAPVVFMLVNNGWAISTPTARQTRAKELYVRAAAYGFGGVRVDGNDVLAVREAAGEAIARAREGGGPTLIEAVSYRMGGHTNSDNPKLYRQREEEERWLGLDPIPRFRDHVVRSIPDADARLTEIDGEVEAELDRAADDWLKEIGRA